MSALDAPGHFWDFMEDGDLNKFADKERQMNQALAEKIVNSLRWLAQITYNDGTPDQSIAFEELDELHDIIERGPDWNAINKIVVTLNRRSSV
jgi:hypothetical protein